MNEDPCSWDLLIERFGALLFAVCFRILRNRQLAEDAVQETWKRIVATNHPYDGSHELSAWLTSIARNAALDQLRRAVTRQKHTGGDFAYAEQIAVAPEEDADPEKEQLLDRLDQEIRELSAEQQAVLLLVSNENRTRPGLGYATQKATAEALDYRNAHDLADHNRVNRLLEGVYQTLLKRLP
jgi:RNA polymerase sigma factor (sigma-70 family)